MITYILTYLGLGVLLTGVQMWMDEDGDFDGPDGTMMFAVCLLLWPAVVAVALYYTYKDWKDNG